MSSRFIFHICNKQTFSRVLIYYSLIRLYNEFFFLHPNPIFWNIYQQKTWSVMKNHVWVRRKFWYWHIRLVEIINFWANFSLKNTCIRSFTYLYNKYSITFKIIAVLLQVVAFQRKRKNIIHTTWLKTHILDVMS